MKIVAFADTHGFHPALPDGDMLIFAGDFTQGWDRNPGQLEEFASYISKQSHKYKIAIAGNHDRVFEEHPISAPDIYKSCGVVYLHHQPAEVSGLKVFGSPYHPKIAGSFGLSPNELLLAWSKIPWDIQILITHGPPLGVLDGDGLGDRSLRAQFNNVMDRVHVFGHIHEGYGQQDVARFRFFNVSHCDIDYRPVNPPIAFEV